MTLGQVFKATLVILLTLFTAYVLTISARIIVVLFIAIIIASAVRPLVEGVTRLRIPHGLAIVLVYATLAVTILVLSIVVVPPIVNQVAQYIESDWRLSYRIIEAQRSVENIISDVTQDEVSLVAPEEIRDAVSDFVREVERVMPTVLDDIGATLGDAVLILVMGAYWLTSHEKAKRFIAQLSMPRFQATTEKTIHQVEESMGSYVRGILTISTTVGLLNLIVLSVLGVENSVTIAFIIAIGTTVPIIGGLIGGAIGTVIALISSPTDALIVFVTFLIINQLENYVLAPRIMSNSVGLDPLLVIVYTSVGFVMFGVTGALIAIPIMGTIHIILYNFFIEPYARHARSYATEEGIPIFRDNGEPPEQEQDKNTEHDEQKQEAQTSNTVLTTGG